MQVGSALEQPRSIRTARKRLFVGLISFSCLIICLFLALLWVVPFIGLDTIHPAAKWVLGGVILILIGFVCVAYWGLFLNIITKKPLPGAKRFRGLTIKLFLPLMVLLGRVLGIDKQHIKLSFITVNNELVLAEAGRYAPKDILLLMPHCLQNSKCDRRLTYDINNCKRCGKCPMAGLLDLHDRYGVNLAIATGGTIARRIVVQLRPRLIIAVACYRDLSSGIQDTYPLPVYGVLNQRPNGPCLDTTVNLGEVETMLHRFIDTDKARDGRTISTGEAAQA
ncbi:MULTISPECIES: DUF116 domain-containing protein [unclassified Pseudodesulfovibrio]|uniref:DUF116 domain-containing protein n=1 Tax=unclassified Pseudodesulfovibrio TaxID=2661612 RepID=UPI000FEB66D6|nr:MULTISPECIES: DUF116 domain-containing protein [unclassified Pseudodesulfovibrio]MCJ2165577.1 DUF116 domain-containing protein [Pseudodesulfovibrio sp. S3-i]RWU03063.1 DUF116 domain-containing protein [Pseudodesulfovibrio sp. S3]